MQSASDKIAFSKTDAYGWSG